MIKIMLREINIKRYGYIKERKKNGSEKKICMTIIFCNPYKSNMQIPLRILGSSYPANTCGYWGRAKCMYIVQFTSYVENTCGY